MPTATQLVISGQSKPGALARVTAVLGEAGVNIATFNLGRRKEGGEAVALVAVDDPIGADLAEDLHHLPGVREVVPLSF